MTKQLQLISIKILNSSYKFLFNSIISLIIYFCFYDNLTFITFCTNENLPLIAEPKISNIKGTYIPTPLQIEIAGLLDYANIIQDQSKQIMEQNTQIQSLLNVQEEIKAEQKQEIENLLDKEAELTVKNMILEKRLEDEKKDIYPHLLAKISAECDRDIYEHAFKGLSKDYTNLVEHRKKEISKAYVGGKINGLLIGGLLGISALALAGILTNLKKW